MSWRILYLTTVGLVLAGIVHIAIVLLVPEYGTRGAWSFLSGRTDMYSFTALRPNETGSAISEVDPFFSYGICRFDLAESGVRIAGPQISGFWSASVFDDDGAVVYSLNNRTAIDNTLDLLIVSPLQGLELREAQVEIEVTSVVIEASITRGFTIIRLFQPDETWSGVKQGFLDQVSCDRFAVNPQ